MKTIIILIMLACSASVASAENWYRELNTDIEKSGFDKALHVVGGTAISYYMAEHTDIARPIAALTPAGIGLVKELTDENFDYGDLASWAISGYIGAYLIPGLFVHADDDEVLVGYSFGF